MNYNFTEENNDSTENSNGTVKQYFKDSGNRFKKNMKNAFTPGGRAKLRSQIHSNGLIGDPIQSAVGLAVAGGMLYGGHKLGMYSNCGNSSYRNRYYFSEGYLTEEDAEAVAIANKMAEEDPEKAQAVAQEIKKNGGSRLRNELDEIGILGEWVQRNPGKIGAIIGALLGCGIYVGVKVGERRASSSNNFSYNKE